jgi:HlyD family secretion protein
MSDAHNIFRQAALARLSSPEQLDQLMQVTTPKSWLALACCCVLLGVAIVWGIWGSVRIDVHGRGILIKKGGVFVATAFGDGRVADILVGEDQPVTNHQLLARLRVPELELRILQAATAQTNLENEFTQLEAYQANERSEEAKYQEAELTTYESISNDYRVQIGALEERLKDLKELSEGTSGVIDRPTLLGVRNDLFAARHGVDLTSVQIKQGRVSRLQAEERRHQQWLDKRNLVEQGRHNLEYLTNLYLLTAEVRSPFSGTVLEITVKPNQLVNVNTPVMSLQSAQERLEAWLFLQPGDGKRVVTNMEARLELVSAKKEEFGMMLGRVASVSALPATPQLMLRVLENPTLVSEFSQEGAPMYIVVELARNANTEAYRWTSRNGANLKITSGTLCDGTITLRNRRPISLVLPMMRQGTGF